MGERQQINLYQPAEDLSRRPFSARAAATSVGVVAAALMGIWGYGSWQLRQVQQTVDVLRQQQRQAEDTVNAAGAMHAARANPEQLQAQIKDLSAQIAIRRRAIELLRGGAEGRPVGFAARLTGLARRHVEGLWVDRIVLSGSSDTMTLEGAALEADLVPRYLRGLAQDPSLAGARFDDLVIERLVRTPHGDDRGGDKGGDKDDEAAQVARPAPHSTLRFRAESGALTGTQRAGASS